MGYLVRAWHLHIILLQIGLAALVCSGLTCWKCIGKFCAQDPADDYRASRVTCRDGEQCMKVYYKMDDLISATVIEGVTRSCSLGACRQQSVAAFETCLRSKHYNYTGCALRSCCNEDFCNASSSLIRHRKWRDVLFTLLFPLFINVLK